jgi:C-terminal processing protease CtpA/Prc
MAAGVSSVAIAQSGTDNLSTGMTLAQPKDGCPVLVWRIWPHSPAARAGARSGDLLVAVDGQPVSALGLDGAAKRLRAEPPGPVSIKVRSRATEREIEIDRARSSTILAANGMKTVGDALVPVDTTKEEVQRMDDFDGRRIVDQVFPMHYPSNTQLYFAGFEVFVLQNPSQIAVGGIEDGPGARAGLHWGDVIVSVNGVSPAGKSTAELESLFSSTRPTMIRLEINRMGQSRIIEFPMEQTSEVLRQNDRRILNGWVIPMAMSDEDARCLGPVK